MNNIFRISVVFGTRPEIIKLSPVIAALTPNYAVQLSNVFTGQQENLAPEFLQEFGIPISHQLKVMQSGQSLPALLATLIDALDECLNLDKPDAVVVQGDTSSALAGAIVASLHKIPVLHIEAGLRTFDPSSPFPEESNRKVITQLATHHFAATEGNRNNLLHEGIQQQNISVTGNPIVDIVMQTAKTEETTPKVDALLKRIQSPKLIVLTAHRRENFDSLMAKHFRVLRDFVDSNLDYSLIAPVHPNPIARDLIVQNFENHERILMIEPLGYSEFLTLLSSADLIVSDSGGIQEEAASLNRPLLILRETTERPEALECGIAKLAPSAETLRALLNTFVKESRTNTKPLIANNPFGNGCAGPLIADGIISFLQDKHAPDK